MVATLGGCAGSQRQTGLIREHPAVTASTIEFRFEVVEVARFVASDIEASSDAIRAASDDPAVRREALRWKVNAIPEIQAAAVGPDPFIAGMDLWALVVQMRNFFTTGNGAAAFGEHAHIAREAMARAEQRLNAGAARLSTAAGADARPGIEKWALEHPLEGFDFRRESLGAAYAQSLRSDREGGFAALDAAQASMERLEYRLALMNEYFPKQMSWNAELSALDMSSAPGMDSILSNLDQTLLSTSQLAEQAPGLLDSERIALLEGVRAERIAAFASIDEQRRQTLEAISRERQAVMQDVTKLANEQRTLAMNDVDQLVERRARGIIDFALLRLAQIVGSIALIGIAVYALWRLSRTGEGRGRFRAERRGSPWSAQNHPGRRASDRRHPAF